MCTLKKMLRIYNSPNKRKTTNKMYPVISEKVRIIKNTKIINNDNVIENNSFIESNKFFS